ncbi:hypothetical protein Bca4012_009941 [Brassica carinata]
MDYNSGPSGYGDDSYHRHLQNEQLPPSDYVVETVDDRRNGGASAVDTGGMQMTQSSDHRHSSSSMSSPGKLFVGEFLGKQLKKLLRSTLRSLEKL